MATEGGAMFLRRERGSRDSEACHTETTEKGHEEGESETAGSSEQQQRQLAGERRRQGVDYSLQTD